ncbi:YncE family protein, partial [bacterium]|nr:YncE family protein [bacterium]
FSNNKKEEYFRSRYPKLTSSVWRYKTNFKKVDLVAIPNDNPHPEPIINRTKPERMLVGPRGEKLYLTLAGSEQKPGNKIAVFDIREKRISKTIKVGQRPYNIVMHPSKKYALVSNELSNYLSVIRFSDDTVISYIPLDYYAQGIAITKDGKRAYVAIRYLDQVLVVDLEEKDNKLTGKVKVIGGFDEKKFLGGNKISKNERLHYLKRGYKEDQISKALTKDFLGINSILKSRCAKCHQYETGGFYSGDDRERNYLSAVENSIGGDPKNSPLLRAITKLEFGGYGDNKKSTDFHSGGALIDPSEKEYQEIYNWIKAAKQGPGIRVGNEMSHPKDVVLSSDEKYLFVGNTGTMDIAVINTKENQLVGGFYLQNLTNHLSIISKNNQDWLIALSMGLGFGATKSRDPMGAETWDKMNEAAQFTLLRDPKTTDSLPLDQQKTMGPFDAVD